MSAPESFTTTRLTARRVTPEDEQRWIADWNEHGFGLWILRDRSSNESVGWTMLTATDTGGQGGVEHAGLPHVIYRLDRATWEQTNG